MEKWEDVFFNNDDDYIINIINRPARSYFLSRGRVSSAVGPPCR
jgi:hypothetical protein